MLCKYMKVCYLVNMLKDIMPIYPYFSLIKVHK